MVTFATALFAAAAIVTLPGLAMVAVSKPVGTDCGNQLLATFQSPLPPVQANGLSAACPRDVCAAGPSGANAKA